LTNPEIILFALALAGCVLATAGYLLSLLVKKIVLAKGSTWILAAGFFFLTLNLLLAAVHSSGWTSFDPKASPYQGTTSAIGTGGTYSSTADLGTAGMKYTSRFEDFDNDFRSDWQTRYRSSGYGYERYQPAYRYGWESRSRYQGRNWSDVEADLRSDWQGNHPNDAWEDFKDSIRTGWERFKEGVSGAASDVRQGAREMGQDVERTYDRTTSDMSRTFDRYDPDFRSNWEQSYRSRGYGYERYQPAYRYGYMLAVERPYRGSAWDEIELDARRDWEMQHPGDRWEDFKDAVRHAWQRVRADVRDAVD
jgi:hypothetical protein